MRKMIGAMLVFYACSLATTVQAANQSKPMVQEAADTAGGLAEQILKCLFSDRGGPQHDITSSKPVVAMIWGPAPPLPEKFQRSKAEPKAE